MKSNKIFLVLFSAFLISIATLSIYQISEHQELSNDKKTNELRVSWMRTWATSGQLMAVLTNTNIAELNGSGASFPDFLFGPEINEAARSGAVDVTNTGVVPTVNLLSVDDDWMIVSRLIYFNVSVVVPRDSKINEITDLKGRSVGVPFGGGSHPYMLQRLKEAGIGVGDGHDEVRLVNIKPPEQALVLSLNEVDAVATWEPQTAISIEKADGKIIDEDVHVGFITVRKSVAEKSPEKVISLLKAYIDSSLYVAMNQEVTDQWFVNKSGFDADLLKKIKVIEPNVGARDISEISMTISDQDIKRSQIVANVMYESGLTEKRVILSDRIDSSYLEKAIEQIAVEGSKLADLKKSE